MPSSANGGSLNARSRGCIRASVSEAAVGTPIETELLPTGLARSAPSGQATTVGYLLRPGYQDRGDPCPTQRSVGGLLLELTTVVVSK